jgi:hypothetical protein
VRGGGGGTRAGRAQGGKHGYAASRERITCDVVKAGFEFKYNTNSHLCSHAGTPGGWCGYQRVDVVSLNT